MKIDIIDIKSKEFEDKFIESLQKTGFAVLTNHGIPFQSIRKTQDVWSQFFLKSESFKNKYIDKENPNMGFKKFKSEIALKSKVEDLKSFFHYKLDYKVPDFVEAETYSMFCMLELLSEKLLSVIDDREGTSFQGACRDSDKTVLRILHYPAMDFDSENAVRAAEHEDISLLTLLVAASAPGLQVKDLNGNWHNVPFEENSIVVNVGDMLQLATSGRYKSTTHKVINPKNKNEERISIPLFVHPTGDTLLSGNITAEDFLNDRLDKIYKR